MKLNEKLLSLRREHQMTQEELAQALSVSRQSIYKWETGRALPDVERLKQICRLFGVSSDELLEIHAPDNSHSTVALVGTESEAPPVKTRKKKLPWLIFGAAIILAFALLAIALTYRPPELRQAEALDIVPSEMTGGPSKPVTERELLSLLLNICEKDNGEAALALSSAASAATNEQLTREKAAYWLYCTHIWAKIDPGAALSVETASPQISQRNVYEELNALSRSIVDGMDMPWERTLCRELAATDELFARYDGTEEMDAKINAILYGPYYTSVAFCLAQRSFLNEKPLMDCDADSFRPKDKLTREEAVIAVYRLYGSW